MDLSKVKNKLASLNKVGEVREKVDFSKIFWKSKDQKVENVLRVVPSKYYPDMPFTEVKMHYNIGHPMMCLSNVDKQDTVLEFISQLEKDSNEENQELARSLRPKTRIFVPVIDRADEEQGVRLWGMGIKLYKQMLSWAQDEEYGDFTDIQDGIDIKVNFERIENSNNYTSVAQLKRRNSPLSDDPNKIKTWLENQPHPIEDQIEFDYDYIKNKLKDHIDGVVPSSDTSSEGTSTSSSTPKVEIKTNPETPKKSEDTLSTSSSGNSNFDSLFG